MKTFSGIAQQPIRLQRFLTSPAGLLKGFRVGPTHYAPSDVELGVVAKPGQVIRIETAEEAITAIAIGATSDAAGNLVLVSMPLDLDR